MPEKRDKLLQRRLKLFKKIEKNLDFIKGSLSRVSRKNKIVGEFYHLTYKDEFQKTHTRYISAGSLEKVRKGIRKMEKIRKLINEISIINIEQLKQK